MDFFFRKSVIALLVALGFVYYLRTHYYLIDLIDYTHRHPDSAAAMPMTDYYVGLTYFMREKYEPATRAFNQLLADYPDSRYNEYGLFRMAEAYEEMRDWKNAKESYEKYFEKYPTGKETTVARGRYDHIKFN